MDSILTILLLLADTCMKQPTQTIGHGDQYLPVVVYNKKVMYFVFSQIGVKNEKYTWSASYVQRLVRKFSRCLSSVYCVVFAVTRRVFV